MDHTASEEENADDDEVVQEFDVYVSKTLNGKLYLLQYPVLSSKRSYGPRDREVAKIKPINNKLELDVMLDISSPNYDQSKGEQIALNVDGNDGASQASTVFDTNVMDKQTFHSTTVPVAGKRYMCGVVQNGSVHLTPISNLLQLQPSFKYMDQAECRAMKAAKAKEAAEADSSQDEAEDAKAVTLRIKGAETEAVRLARERSYAAHEKRLADEKWKRLRMHSKTSDFTERDRQKLICQNIRQQDGGNERMIPEMVQTPKEYLTKLAPLYSEHAVDNTAMPSNVLSLSHLKNESLGEQLKLIMKNVKIIHFSHLQSLLPSHPDASVLVRSLQSYAMLVRGCWVVKSEVLFPPKSTSPISGTPAESLCRSRDYILSLFTKREHLARKEVTSTVKIPGDDVKAILEDISTMRVGHGWTLRLSPDRDFMVRFPEVCERQAMLWNALGVKLAKQMNLPADLVNEIGNVSMEIDRSPAQSRTKKSSSSADEKSIKTKSPKLTAKRQRKCSGPKNTASSPSTKVKVKTEAMSPPASMYIPEAGLKKRNGDGTNCADTSSVENSGALTSVSESISPPGPFAIISVKSLSSSPFLATTSENASNPLQPFVTNQGDSPQRQSEAIVATNGTLNSDINLDSVNFTVQSIANEMIKIGSPDSNAQYYIPQTTIATSLLEVAEEPTANGTEEV